ncbi:hypothetical protein [Dactylosporangium darangshiense]|uniref:Uncharacterized protein n=1 Tax=Dactylosporangium darangshiense TaxID=579108 RepID=A0ABP8DR17_9ACTN
MTSDLNPDNRDERPVIAINDRGLILGVDAHGSWIIWTEDETVWPAHTVWLAYDHLLWLMPLLQKPQDVVTEAIAGADADNGVLPAVLRYALGCWSGYWAGLALAWLEAGYPSTELIDALQALKDSPRQPQPVRHRALRLWRKATEPSP